MLRHRDLIDRGLSAGLVGGLPVLERFQKLHSATEAAVFSSPGRTNSGLRKALGRGEAPAELQSLVHKIRDQPWSVTDQDWLPARSQYDQEQLFELVVASALGAASYRLEAALRALEQA